MKTRPALLVLPLLPLAALLYLPALGFPLIDFDDPGLVASRQLDRMAESGPLAAFLPEDGSAWQPLRTLSYHVDRTVAGGVDPSAHHLSSLLWYLAAVAAAFVCLRRIGLVIGLGPDRAGVLALIGTSLFVLHPASVDGAVWIAGRKEALLALFVLLGTTGWLAWTDRPVGGKVGRLAMAVGGAAAAVLSKGFGVMTPVWYGALLYHRRERSVRAWSVAAGLCLATAAVWFWLLRGDVERIGGGGRPSLPARAVASGVNWFRYALDLAIPIRPSIVDTGIPPAEMFSPASLAAAAAGLVICLAGLLVVLRRGRYAPFIALIGLFLLPASPFLGLFSRGNRYLFLPAVAWGGIVALLLLDQWRPGTGKVRRTAAALLALVYAGLLGSGTIAYRDAFASTRELWLHQLGQDPRSWFALTRLGGAELKRGRPAEAEGRLRQSLALRPDFDETVALLAVARFEQGATDDALRLVRDSAPLFPDSPIFQQNRLVLLLRLGFADEARAAWDGLTEDVRREPGVARLRPLVTRDGG